MILKYYNNRKGEGEGDMSETFNLLLVIFLYGSHIFKTKIFG